MLVLALDTTTRAGGVALMRGETLLAAEAGDPGRTHGERLPGDIVRLLARPEVSLSAIDLFAVAVGPGSFTGLRIGIATMQGLALANGKALAGVPTLDALALSAQAELKGKTGLVSGTIAVWMDAQRHDVFAAIYRAEDLTSLDGPLVGTPDEVRARWSRFVGRDQVWFVGDGAIAYRTMLPTRSGRVALIDPTPLVAPAVAALAIRQAERGQVYGPDAIRPLYVRRPDAELARERTKARVDR